MKKSLLIAPALGVLVLAAAGSVGGTVAWFSSNTAWDNKAGEFAITKLDGNLTAAVSSGVGTKVSTANAKNIVVAEEGANTNKNKLTHGSYDYKGGKAYVLQTEAHDDIPAVFAKKEEADALSTGWKAAEKDTVQPIKKANNVYYAVSWQVAFTYAFPADKTAVNLYFDFNSTDGSKAAKDEEDHSTKEHQTYKGFRVAIVGQAAGDNGATYKRVWAPNQTTLAQAQKYVAGEGNDLVGARALYSTDDLIYTATTKINEGQKGANERPDCIGQFTTDTENASKTLTFKFVAWFEGEDENVVDDAELQTIPNVSLKFYTRQDDGTGE